MENYRQVNLEPFKNKKSTFSCIQKKKKTLYLGKRYLKYKLTVVIILGTTMILTFILRSDCRSGINNRRIGKLGCMISLLYASKALTPHFNRFLGVDPGLLIFKFGNRLGKTKPKTFPFSAGKHFWFRQCLLENLRHFHCETSLHSSGLSSHHEEQNSRESPESTCV